jgi:hypothetical protein
MTDAAITMTAAVVLTTGVSVEATDTRAIDDRRCCHR